MQLWSISQAAAFEFNFTRVKYFTCIRGGSGEAEYCDERVHLSVCQSARISQKPYAQTFQTSPDFLYIYLTVAVTLSVSAALQYFVYFRFCRRRYVCLKVGRTLKLSHHASATDRERSLMSAIALFYDCQILSFLMFFMPRVCLSVCLSVRRSVCL